MPLHRGLFEDYVANFWCVSHTLIKWRRWFTKPALLRMCLLATVSTMLPAAVQQVAAPSRRGFLYCLLCSSLAFFLFSYQVRLVHPQLPVLPPLQLTGALSARFRCTLILAQSRRSFEQVTIVSA